MGPKVQIKYNITYQHWQHCIQEIDSNVKLESRQIQSCHQCSEWWYILLCIVRQYFLIKQFLRQFYDTHLLSIAYRTFIIFNCYQLLTKDTIINLLTMTVEITQYCNIEKLNCVFFKYVISISYVSPTVQKCSQIFMQLFVRLQSKKSGNTGLPPSKRRQKRDITSRGKPSHVSFFLSF